MKRTALDTAIRRRNSEGEGKEIALVIHRRPSSVRLDWATLDEETGTRAELFQRAVTRVPNPCICIDTSDHLEMVLQILAAMRLTCPVAIGITTSSDEAPSISEVVERSGLSSVRVADGQSIATRYSTISARVVSATALVTRTGGSTGSPRLTVNSTMRMALERHPDVRLSTATRLQSQDHQLILGGLDHSAGLGFFLEGLVIGAEVHVLSTYSAAFAIEIIERESISWIHALPYHLQSIKRIDESASASMRSVRTLVHTSAVCSPIVKTYWHKRLTPQNVFEVFGSSEGLGVSVARGDEWENRPGTVGRGLFSKFRVIIDGRLAKPGEVGTIYWRVPGQPTPAYLGQKTREYELLPGYASVGDRGWMDDKHYLYIEPRQFERITIGGNTVDVTEVETVLLSNPNITDVAVCSADDAIFGRRIVAVVVANDDTITTTAVRAFARHHLQPWAVPRHVVMTEKIERLSSGKIDRRRLAKLILDTKSSSQF